MRNIIAKNRSFLFLFFLYSFRFFYCYAGYLKNYTWLKNGDESHVYLLGLNFYTSHVYPFWGPDIVYTNSFLVGGMQGLLVGLPLFIWHHPFAPYVFLFAILSTGLIYLSRYISKLFPGLPKWIIYSVVALAPFSMHTGLKIINPAYVLCFSIPFMLSFMEVFKIFPQQFIDRRWRYFWMGLGVTAIFQLHASWILLFLALGAAVVYELFQWKGITKLIQPFVFCCAGLVLGGVSLIPTVYHYGYQVLFIQGKNLHFDISHFSDVGTLIFCFVTACGYEMNSFDSHYCWNSLLHRSSIFSAILFGILQVSGLLLFILQIILLPFKPWRNYIQENKRFLLLTAIIIAIMSFMYLFSFVRAHTHAIIFLYPLSAIYLCSFLHYFLQKHVKIRNMIYGIFMVLLITYYCVIVFLTNLLPVLGYREKAFEAIEKKAASIFEIPRFPYPTDGN